MPELRKDPITSQWVIIATERRVRPRDLESQRHVPRGRFCPFCPGNEEAPPPEITAVRHEVKGEERRWRVRVFPSKFPALKATLRRLNVALDHPPCNLVLHTAPLRQPELVDYHWHLELIPTLTRVAGFEWGSGFTINPTPPEDAAAFLRAIEAH